MIISYPHSHWYSSGRTHPNHNIVNAVTKSVRSVSFDSINLLQKNSLQLLSLLLFSLFISDVIIVLLPIETFGIECCWGGHSRWLYINGIVAVSYHYIVCLITTACCVTVFQWRFNSTFYRSVQTEVVALSERAFFSSDLNHTFHMVTWIRDAVFLITSPIS